MRTFGVSRNTVKDWLKKAANLPPLKETLLTPDPDDPDATIMEFDELWSFVFKKGIRRGSGLSSAIRYDK